MTNKIDKDTMKQFREAIGNGNHLFVAQTIVNEFSKGIWGLFIAQNIFKFLKTIFNILTFPKAKKFVKAV